MNDPVVDRWYINRGMPLSNPQRLMVFKIRGGLVHLTDDPASLMMPGKRPREVVWEVEAFRVFFLACEDLSHSVVLPACSHPCGCCDNPIFVAAAKKAVRLADKARARRDAVLAEVRLAKTRRRLRQAARPRPIMDQVIQTRKAR